MKTKVLLFLFIILVLTVSLTACKVKFDDLTIIAESVTDVEEGEYTLDYTIDNLEKYSENFDLTISVKIFDDNNKAIPVENNRTFTAKPDNIYYVTVYVKTSVDGKYKTVSKSYTITTVKTDPKLILKLEILNSTYEHMVINLTYGQSYDINTLPTIPNANPTDEGISYTLKEKYWVIYSANGNRENLTQQHLDNITKTMTIYAYYDFSSTPKICTLSFNANGGNEIESITSVYGSSIERVADPIREDYYFLGWYDNENFTDLFNWTNSTTMPATKTLYAKWLEDNNSNAAKESFNYEYVADDNTGYGYYKITAKSYELPSEIIIPNGYNNKPIKTIGEYAFSKHTEITSITVPDTIITIGNGAFRGCDSLSNIDISNCGIDRLNAKVFENCTSLTTLIVPDAVTNIINEAFLGCENLETLNFSQQSKLKTLTTNTFISTAIGQLTLPFYMKNKAVAMTNKNGIKITLDFFEELPQ